MTTTNTTGCPSCSLSLSTAHLLDVWLFELCKVTTQHLMHVDRQDTWFDQSLRAKKQRLFLFAIILLLSHTLNSVQLLPHPVPVSTINVRLSLECHLMGQRCRLPVEVFVTIPFVIFPFCQWLPAGCSKLGSEARGSEAGADLCAVLQQAGSPPPAPPHGPSLAPLPGQPACLPTPCHQQHP